jgi:hypothetical protein
MNLGRTAPLPPDPDAAVNPAQLPPKPSRFKQCSVCSQWFDTENLDHVSHHDTNPHEPLLPR